MQNARPLVLGHVLDAAQSLLVDDDDLARLHVAHELGVDQIQRAGLARKHPAIVQLADAKRTEPMRIAHADQLGLRHDDERKGAFDPAHRLDEIVRVSVQARLRHQMQDDLAIDRRLKNGALGLQLLAQLRRVGQVAVVRDGDLAFGAIDGERLRIGDVGGTGRGIARVAHRHRADQIVQHVAVENLRHQSHAAMHAKLFAGQM